MPTPPYGQLSVVGTKLKGSNGQDVALHGMSLFWSQWDVGATFYTYQTIQALKSSWNVNVVRAAMGVENGGYLSNRSVELAKLYAVVDAAIDLGIYVIIDWHDHNAQRNIQAAVSFFSAISQKYGSRPNVLYETFNEPLRVDWTSVIKPYHQQVVAAIRANDPHNVILLGTPNWSQDVDVAARDPLSGSNLMYTLHYYAATHKQDKRDKAQSALNQGLAIFVTEYGTVEASGDGQVDQRSSNDWFTFLDRNNVSYVNWSIANKAEGASAFTPGTTDAQVADDSRLTASGAFVKNKLLSQNNGLTSDSAPVTSSTQRATNSSTQIQQATNPSQTFGIMGSNGRFVCGENGQGAVTCNRTQRQAWETFTLEALGNGRVALKCMGKYLCSENGQRAMNCNRLERNAWEIFEWIDNNDGTFSLRGNNGKFVSSEDGQRAITCNRDQKLGWEKFKKISL